MLPIISVARRIPAIDRNNMVPGLPTRCRRRCDVARVQFERAGAGMVGRAVCVGVAVEGGLLRAVVLQPSSSVPPSSLSPPSKPALHCPLVIITLAE